MSKGKKVRNICLALGLTTVIAATGAKVIIRENGYRSVAKELVNRTYISEDNSLFLGEQNNSYELPEYKETTRVTRGKYIEEEIEARDILYCELLDEYYTRNGVPIAIIDTYYDEGKTVQRRVEVLENIKEEIEIKENETIRIVPTLPYYEIYYKDVVVKMDKEAIIISQENEMYKGSIGLK